MEACKSQSKLFVYSSVDYRDEEEKYERAHQYVQQQIAGLSDKELHDILNQLVNKEKTHEEICVGLLYIILTDEQLAPKTYRDLTLISRDGLQLVISNLNILLVEKYSKLSEVGRRQLLWLVRELIKNQVQNVENIVWNCLRQASGGDISPRNLYLVEGLLDIFIEQRQWLEKNSFYVCLVVYTYVRLLEDHCSNNPVIVNLRNKEVKFVISLIRDRFVDIISLGRDFVRLLQNVSRIPEFSLLWRDMLLNPKSLSPSFTGVWQLLQIRTSRRYLQSRLTPEVERKLHFLTSNVKFGNHKRYQDWFQEKYFNTPESHSLRSDLIRFIINVIHPTNDMLCSDIIPRWAIIGWLLTSCTNPVAQSNAKLALFYDWLFFDPTKDNIMNVEPGILVMYHSIRNHPLVSSTLLDFLCRIIKNFLPKNEDKIRAGVYNSLRKILEKQVITNLHPLFESPKLDRELKNLIRDNFREFCSISSSSTVLPVVGQPPILNDADFRNNSLHSGIQHPQLSTEEIKILQQQQQIHHHSHTFSQPPLQNHNNNILSGIDHQIKTEIENNSNGSVTVSDGTANAVQKEEIDNEPEAVFSDDEGDQDIYNKNEELTDDDDDLPLSKVRLKEKPTVDKVDLPSSISDSFEKYITAKTTQTFDSFLNDFRTLSPSALNSEQQLYVYSQTVQVLKQTIPKSKFPESKSDEKLLAESINCPLFSICRTMYQYEDKLKKSFQNFLTYIYKKIPDVGYMLLYFLKVYSKLQSRKNTNQSYTYKSNIYKQLCEIGNDDTNDINGNNNNEEDDEDDGDNEKCTGSELLIKCLIKDLTNLESENTHIFLWLIPDIFREFKTNVINNSEIIRIILSCIDAKNLRDLVYNVTQGKLLLFKNEGILECIRDSLEYETFEQYCLWQLVQAHDVPIEVIQKILPELESSKHAEALTSILFLLKHEKPTTELIRLLLSRETRNRGDSFVTSALRFWCTDSEEILSEIVANLLMSKYPNSSPNKRKRPAKNQSAINSTPSADQLLNHLEHFRRSCRHGNGTGTGLYVQDQMQNALQQAYSHSSDSIKKQYSDLFALAAEDETSGISRRGGTGRGRKQSNNKKDTNSSHNTNKKNFESVNNYSSEGESSDDEWAKPKQSKRRKKALSDSD